MVGFGLSSFASVVLVVAAAGAALVGLGAVGAAALVGLGAAALLATWLAFLAVVRAALAVVAAALDGVGAAALLASWLVCSRPGSARNRCQCGRIGPVLGGRGG